MVLDQPEPHMGLYLQTALFILVVGNLEQTVQGILAPNLNKLSLAQVAEVCAVL